MKQTTKKVLALLLVAIALFSFASCKNEVPPDVSDNRLWNNALYTEDTALGEGAKHLGMMVTAEGKTIVFNIYSDAETVGEALMENGLVEGADGQFGLYISHVNGIKAVYEEDGAYWAFHDRDGELMSTGVDMTELHDGDVYELRYTKE